MPPGRIAAPSCRSPTLPEPLHETAYWLALEIALSDSRVMLEEVRILDAIRRALGLDRLVAAALERGARARYQVG